MVFPCCFGHCPKSPEELLQNGTWDGLDVGCAQGRVHPFNEPFRNTDSKSKAWLDKRRREKPRDARLRRCVLAEKVLAYVCRWVRHERYFFMARVCFWSSTWSLKHMTPKSTLFEGGRNLMLPDFKIDLAKYAFNASVEARANVMSIFSENDDNKAEKDADIENEDLEFDPRQELEGDFKKAAEMHDIALLPEGKKCKNANEDAADVEPQNEHQSKFDARGDVAAVVDFRIPEKRVPWKCNLFLPCEADPELHTRHQFIQHEKMAVNKMAVNRCGLMVKKSHVVGAQSHDLLLVRMCRGRGKLVFEDQMFCAARCWANIIFGRAFRTIGGEPVIPKVKLQAAVAHACLFLDIMLPYDKRGKLLEDDAAQAVLNQALTILANLHGKHLWGLPRESIPYRNFPDEMLTKPESLWRQYVAFRDLHSLVAKHKMTVEVEHVWVQVGNETPWVLTRAECSKWSSEAVLPGSVLVSKSGLRCKVVECDVRICDSLMHSAMMTVNYAHVKKRNIWHMRLYHRSKMSSLTSEMYCEYIGSLLRFVEKRHSVGRQLETNNLIQAVMLRAVGATGGLHCLPFVCAALERHFGDRGFHFFLTSPTVLTE